MNSLLFRFSNNFFAAALDTVIYNEHTYQRYNGTPQNIHSEFIYNLMQKFGIDTNAAYSIATNLIPIVMQQLVHKINDANDNSFGLQSIIRKSLSDLTPNEPVQKHKPLFIDSTAAVNASISLE